MHLYYEYEYDTFAQDTPPGKMTACGLLNWLLVLPAGAGVGWSWLPQLSRAGERLLAPVLQAWER